MSGVAVVLLTISGACLVFFAAWLFVAGYILRSPPTPDLRLLASVALVDFAGAYAVASGRIVGLLIAMAMGVAGVLLALAVAASREGDPSFRLFLAAVIGVTSAVIALSGSLVAYWQRPRAAADDLLIGASILGVLAVLWILPWH